MRLILITPPTTTPCEPRVANQLFAAGLPLLHVRKPHADAAALRAYLAALDPAFRARVVLHQHHELALEYQLKGVHYKERDRPGPPLPRAQPGLSQSTSLHSLAELAVGDWGALDYAFLSPVFDSISKQGYAAAGFERGALSAALQRAGMPVYALGGITPKRLPAVRDLGFAGVGVLGAVWESADPVAALQAFQGCLLPPLDS